MRFKVPIRVLKELGEKENGSDYSDLFPSWIRDEDQTVELSSITTPEEDLKFFRERGLHYLSQTDVTIDKDVYKSLKTKFSAYDTLQKIGDTKVIKRLQDIPDAFAVFLKNNFPSGIVYVEGKDGSNCPYVITRCHYEPFDDRRQTPSNTSFRFEGCLYGSSVSHSFTVYGDDLRKTDIGGLTIREILENNNCMIETPELKAIYDKEIERYTHLRELVGNVFNGKGRASLVTEERRSSTKLFYFKKDTPKKVVIDFRGRVELDSSSEKFNDVMNTYSPVLGKSVLVPTHPYGEVWHLEEHCWLKIHVNNLEEYEWKGKDLLTKLILPQTDKDLIEILMNMSKIQIEDIIEGKQGGSFILATGEPGTGKTLSAEVFSEVLEKPLYKVQCSQLGINVDTVEEKLKAVLQRASRWGAVLLLDEGDVYVRERGTDLNQNAIVGVFLRTLEYYRGILFMTSNLETQIDDAILSRATAHLIYRKPDSNDRMKIWEVLSRQFDIEFTLDELKKLRDYFDDIVGRDIKALLKLSKMLAQGRETGVSVDLIKEVAGFVPNVTKKLGTVKEKIN